MLRRCLERSSCLVVQSRQNRQPNLRARTERTPSGTSFAGHQHAVGIAFSGSTRSPSASKSQLDRQVGVGFAGDRSRRASSRGLSLALTNAPSSFAIRFSNSDAGSSFGSCGTSLPRTARLRMVWRSCLIWSGRVVRAGSASSAKRASAWKVSGSGALRRARLAAASRSRVASRLRPRRLQPVAQRHQLIDLGDDAVLFGEGWEGKGRLRDIFASSTCLLTGCPVVFDAQSREMRARSKMQMNPDRLQCRRTTMQS